MADERDFSELFGKSFSGSVKETPTVYNILFLLLHQNTEVAICKDAIQTERELAV